MCKILKKARNEMGISQAALGVKCGLLQETVSKYERPGAVVPMCSLKIVSKVTDTLPSVYRPDIAKWFR